MTEYITPNDRALFAQTDGQTIQNAIDEAVRTGCRKVVIPRYNRRTGKNEWRIEKAIRLPSCFTLILDNCFMVQETGIYDHMFMNENAWQPEKRTMEDEQHDITIRGEGNVILSGGEHNGLLEKTSMRYGMPMVWHNTWGDITLKHVFMGHTIRRLTQLGGKLTVTMEDCQTDAEDLCIDKGEATLIINGKEC